MNELELFLKMNELLELLLQANTLNIVDKQLIIREIFFEITQYNSDTHNARTLTLSWTHVRKPYSYEYLRRLSRQILKIDEVIIGASLSREASHTT